MAHRIAPGLEAFRERWPKVSVQLLPIHSVIQPEALRSADIDIGIMQFDPSWGQGIEWRVIAREPVRVAVPSSWKIAKPRIQLQDLRDRPWLMPDPEVTPRLHARLLRLCQSVGFEPTVGAMVSDATFAGLLLSCGVGATFVFGGAEYTRHEGIEILSIEGHPEPLLMETVVAWAVGSTSRQIQEFVRCVQDLNVAEE